jgi:hypothetical protein
MKRLPKLAAAVGVATAALMVAPEASASHCTSVICRHCQECQSDEDGGVMCWFDMSGGGWMSSCWEHAEYDPETGEVIYEWCEGEYGCNVAE